MTGEGAVRALEALKLALECVLLLVALVAMATAGREREKAQTALYEAPAIVDKINASPCRIEAGPQLVAPENEF